jgi:hypothetical protein
MVASTFLSFGFTGRAAALQRKALVGGKISDIAQALYQNMGGPKRAGMVERKDSNFSMWMKARGKDGTGAKNQAAICESRRFIRNE